MCSDPERIRSQDIASATIFNKTVYASLAQQFVINTAEPIRIAAEQFSSRGVINLMDIRSEKIRPAHALPLFFNRVENPQSAKLSNRIL
jgi:hypothetical protein